MRNDVLTQLKPTVPNSDRRELAFGTNRYMCECGEQRKLLRSVRTAQLFWGTHNERILLPVCFWRRAEFYSFSCHFSYFWAGKMLSNLITSNSSGLIWGTSLCVSIETENLVSVFLALKTFYGLRYLFEAESSWRLSYKLEGSTKRDGGETQKVETRY